MSGIRENERQTFLANDDYEYEPQLQDIRRVKRQLHHTTDTNNNNSHNIINNNEHHNDNEHAYNNNFTGEILTSHTINTVKVKASPTTTSSMNSLNNKRPDQDFHTKPIPSSDLDNNLSVSERNAQKNLNTFNFNTSQIISSPPHSSPFSYSAQENSLTFPSRSSSKTKLSAHFIPLSNGNFNYPNLPTDASSIAERLVAKYKHPLPTLDPIVVALPNAAAEDQSTDSEPVAPTSSVDVESVSLVELSGDQTADSHGSLKLPPSKGLPDYILELNDPDIGGPVDYRPAEDKPSLNVISWGLLPPLDVASVSEATLSHNTINTGHKLKAEASQESSQITQTPQLGLSSSTEFPHNTGHQNSGGRSSSRARTTTTTTKRPTTTAKPITSTTRTTRRTTTPRSTTTTTTTTTTPEPDSSEFFKLEAGDSYTLPPWLQDIDDPDLDVAVTFEIPEDINEYNHTVERDLLAPLEPFTDLSNLHLTSPANHKVETTTASTTTTTTTTTTRRPKVSTNQPHWVRAKPTTAKPTVATFNKQFTSLNPSITSSTRFAQRTTSTAPTTTTVKPKTSITFHNRQFSSNTAQTDQIGSTSSSSEEDHPRTTNPFLRKFDDGKYKPEETYRRTTTTTTTTTTTPAPEKNPFEATLPPWLKDLDYPDLGPGVPFIYNPNEDESPVDKNILPPSQADEDPSSNTPNSFNSPFSNSQTPQGFTNKFITSALSLTSSASIPSITTIPFPSAQQTKQDDSTFTRPPLVLATPTSNLPAIAAEGNDDILKKTSTTFNKHFPAPFDSAASSDQKKTPLSADRESFPPFNQIITTGSSTVPSKTTFSKSEDGKVITNNIFLNGNIGSSSIKPSGSSSSPAATNQEKSKYSLVNY